MQSSYITPQGIRLYTRLIRPTDAELLITLFERLSPESRRRRFHAEVERLDPARVLRTAQELASVDNRSSGGAILALRKRRQGVELLGVARLARPIGEPQSPSAEAAVVVRDDYQRQGIGSHLLGQLVQLARAMGVEELTAVTQPDNVGILAMLRTLKLPISVQMAHGEAEIRVRIGDDTDPTQSAG